MLATVKSLDGHKIAIKEKECIANIWEYIFKVTWRSSEKTAAIE